jgi:hypothetical protein
MGSGVPPLESSVQRKISWARDVVARQGNIFLGDEQLADRLLMLKRAIRQSREAMAQSGITGLCRDCEIHEGGSCCGAGIEKHFSSILLLVNLLLGARIPHSRHDPLSCYFLTENGCQLLARHVLCVNFLCGKVTSRVAAAEIASLREKEGIELDLVFALYEQIRKRLDVTRHDP